MSILTHCFEKDGTLNFIVTSPHHNYKETMKIRQLLAAQPTNPQAPLQVYHYLHESSTSTRPMETPVPPKLETMLLDYVEAGHMDPIQQVVDMSLSSGYYPTETIVLVLMDSLLKRTKNKNKQQRKEKVQQLYKSHALLLQTLELFGPGILTPLWTRLGATRTGKKRHRRHSHDDTNHYDDDEDENEFEHGMRLSRFDDFWDLVNYCFRQPNDKLSLNTLGCRLAMDVLIKLLSKDIRSRKDSLSECLLLSCIPLNAYGVRSNFNRCLDILFSGINSTLSRSSLQAQNTEQAMALLNQLILLSYCGQHLLETASLVDQTYQQIVRLETSTMQHVIQSIQFPAFIASLCDMYFYDTDYSHVATEHLVYRSKQVFSVSKMKNYYMKTRPKQNTMTLSHVLQHCLMVMWRWNAYLGMFSYRYDGTISPTTRVETTRKRADEEGITIDDLMQWKQRLLDLARLCNDNTDELTTDINDIVEMMVLSLDS